MQEPPPQVLSAMVEGFLSTNVYRSISSDIATLRRFNTYLRVRSALQRNDQTAALSALQDERGTDDEITEYEIESIIAVDEEDPVTTSIPIETPSKFIDALQSIIAERIASSPNQRESRSPGEKRTASDNNDRTNDNVQTTTKKARVAKENWIDKLRRSAATIKYASSLQRDEIVDASDCEDEGQEIDDLVHLSSTLVERTAKLDQLEAKARRRIVQFAFQNDRILACVLNALATSDRFGNAALVCKRWRDAVYTQSASVTFSFRNCRTHALDAHVKRLRALLRACSATLRDLRIDLPLEHHFAHACCATWPPHLLTSVFDSSVDFASVQSIDLTLARPLHTNVARVPCDDRTHGVDVDFDDLALVLIRQCFPAVRKIYLRFYRLASNCEVLDDETSVFIDDVNSVLSNLGEKLSPVLANQRLDASGGDHRPDVFPEHRYKELDVLHVENLLDAHCLPLYRIDHLVELHYRSCSFDEEQFYSRLHDMDIWNERVHGSCRLDSLHIESSASSGEAVCSCSRRVHDIPQVLLRHPTLERVEMTQDDSPSSSSSFVAEMCRRYGFSFVRSQRAWLRDIRALVDEWNQSRHNGQNNLLYNVVKMRAEYNRRNERTD